MLGKPRSLAPRLLRTVPSVTLAMRDGYNQLSSYAMRVQVNPVADPTPAIAGAPLAATAPNTVQLRGSNSLCTTQPVTRANCTFSWRISCDGQADIVRSGPATDLTTGPTGVDLPMRGKSGPLDCRCAAVGGAKRPLASWPTRGSPCGAVVTQQLPKQRYVRTCGFFPPSAASTCKLTARTR